MHNDLCSVATVSDLYRSKLVYGMAHCTVRKLISTRRYYHRDCNRRSVVCRPGSTLRQQPECARDTRILDGDGLMVRLSTIHSDEEAPDGAEVARKGFDAVLTRLL